MHDLDSIFAEGGPLSERISGYRLRVSQLGMASRVLEAIESGKHLIAEAGTGTGKTIAYLIPAILSGKRILISTGTRNLQDQLFAKDLPLMRTALSVPFQAALLKGRSNYLCRYRLATILESDAGFSRDEVLDLQRIQRWSEKTRNGDIAEMASVSESSSLWPHVTSTVDNCLGQDCPDYQECYLVKSRRKAQDSEVLVVNHHLLCADWVLRDDGFGELLPAAEVVIVDEAHQLYDTASRFLGLSVSARQMNDLSRDVLIEYLRDASDMPALRSDCHELEKSIKDARLTFGESVRRGSWQELVKHPGVGSALGEVLSRLANLKYTLEPAAERTKGLDSCWRRCAEVEARLTTLLEENGSEWIRWFETHKRTFTLSRTPFSIAEEFQQLVLERDATWVFTSATLSVSGGFDHFKSIMGLEDTTDAVWDSPFDFAEQALFYHPRNLPEPDSENYAERLVETVVPILNASKGRAFFLFTSHKVLRLVADLLAPLIDYPMLVQGSQPRMTLLEQFRTLGDAVLLGTTSFWEGVDVRGEALSCVIIDKLPFASPSDPVMKARLDSLRHRGENPFVVFQLPMAVLALKQGIGRLIRDREDRGVFVLCDPRLLKRSYGRVFLDSLPPMRRTRSIEDVESFFCLKSCRGLG